MSILPSTASKVRFPVIKSAYGKFAMDVDNRIFLDFTGSNNTVILGHRKYDFSYTPNFPGVSELEKIVSDKLSEFTKTSHFRFFKNGNDAVSCAIRLSKHLVGRDSNIYFLGYGGANDTYTYTFNDNGISKQNSKQLDPNNLVIPQDADILVYESRHRYLAGAIKAKIKICDHLKSGILGLQEKMADIDLYGKSIANGYPIAVMTGKDSIMERINEIYYSTTFGGDNVGLEAVLKTISLFFKEDTFKEYMKVYTYATVVLPVWQSVNNHVVEELLKEKIMFNGFWQIMIQHTKDDIDKLAKKIIGIGGF